LLNTTVHQEACINNLAPTSSTTAQMVMGDLVAIALMELSEFTSNDFAKFHPGGNLGKRLTLTAGVIANQNLKPSVQIDTPLKEIITTISKNRMGATVVINEKDNVIGIITDGDIRRMLEQHAHIQSITAKDIYHAAPITIDSNLMAVEAAVIMQQKDISQLIVLTSDKYLGMIHIHDLMREGII
jgi:arabinose-5-phosphate isomerase